VLLQQDRELEEVHHVEGTPSALVVRADGTIGSPVAAGADSIRSLVATAIGAAAQLPPPVPTLPAPASNGGGNGSATAPGQAAAKLGDRAPAIVLHDLKGRRIKLARTRERETLILVWNPQCGFCQQMLDDLKAWEAALPEGAPKLLVVSRGSVDENRGMGLRSPVLLDEDWTATSAFGANGTPMAVLIDEEGAIASEVVAGAPVVLGLARSGKQRDLAAA
jgi:thiol-disulfide isomerase/thioredoxin